MVLLRAFKMSESEYMDLNEFNEFDEDNIFDLTLISIDECENETTLQDRPVHRFSSRHRIENYFEMRRLREQISDPIFNF